VASLSTSCRAPGGNPTRFVVRAHALSTRELFLDASLEVGELEALIPEALRTGLSIVGLESPCPRPAAGARPWLAGPEADERLEAARLCEATLRRAAELGARVVVVKLGELAGFDAAAVLRKFGRRQLDDEAREKLVETRRSLSLRALDRARFGLERCARRRAAAAGVTLGIANRAFWYEIPSAAETAALVDDLRGAPIAPGTTPPPPTCAARSASATAAPPSSGPPPAAPGSPTPPAHAPAFPGEPARSTRRRSPTCRPAYRASSTACRSPPTRSSPRRWHDIAG
jgi:hypothetical protein